MTAHPASPSAGPASPVWGITWWREAVVMAFTIGVVLALDLWQLGATSLWRDEIASVVFSKAPLGDLLTIIGRDRSEADLVNQAAYYVVLHFWLPFGQTETWIRLPSVIFGAASIVPVYFIARRLGGPLAGGLAAGTLALLPHAIRYGQEARAYSLAMLVAGALTWLILVAASRRSSPWLWLAYGLLAAIGLYVHFFVALVIGAHVIWLLATRRLPDWRGLAAGGIPLLAAAVPLPVAILQAGATQEWIPPLSIGQFVTALVDMAGSPWLLLALIALGSLALNARPRDPETWLLVSSVMIPILAAAAISLAKPLFIGRYLIVVLPGFAALAGVAIAALQPGLLRKGAALAMTGLLLLAVPGAYVDTHQQDWRAAGSWMATRTQPGDRMIAGNGLRSIDYYLQRADAAVIPSATRVSDALADRSGGRVWLVLTESEEGSGVRERMAAAFTPVDEQPFGDHLTVVLLVARAPTAQR